MQNTKRCVIKSMSLCFETIKVVEGQPLHVAYHNARCNKTREELFTCKDHLDLSTFINAPDKAGVYRCRIDYAKTIERVVFFPLLPRHFEHFRLKEINFEYAHKWSDRRAIDQAKEGSDAVIFHRNGYLLDTPIANIALAIDDVWITPKTPLLHGTTRARFLDEGWLKEGDLGIDALRYAKKFAIMNALIDWQEIENFTLEELN